LPFFKKRGDVVGRVFGGFQITGIVTYQPAFLSRLPAALHQHSWWSGIVSGRPQGYSGPSDLPTSNEDFIVNGIFGPNGRAFLR
jgi:hypothetical protein